MYNPHDQNLSDDNVVFSSSLSPTSSQELAIQTNGRRVMNFQRNWIGPSPSNACELFIKKIPKNFTEYTLLPHFQRFGTLYEFRLMMEHGDCNRGYGFIKYINEEEAARAAEVMNHFFVQPGKLLEVQKSYDKCRLFVANIPKELKEEELENEFRIIFPSLEKIVMHKRISDRNQNRGFVFLDFPNHEEALNVKKSTTPGRIRKWGRDIKIVWANPERCVDPSSMQNIKTLFVRNVDLTVNTKDIYALLSSKVNRTEIRKISRVREFAFIDFITKEAAEKVLIGLNGTRLKGHALKIDWAMPPTANSVHTLKNSDFDAVLRLKCIANYWSIPVIIFGKVFVQDNLQYVAIMIRENDVARTIFMEINTVNLVDIQSRACEVVVTLIEKIGQLPHYNYVLKVKDDIAYIVGAITNLALVQFVKAIHIAENLYMYWNELVNLSVAVSDLINFTDMQIITMYKNSFMQQISTINLNSSAVYGRILGCILPTYRQKPPLKYNLDNTQVIFALINATTLTNHFFPLQNDLLYNFKDNGSEQRNCPITFCAVNLLPLHFAQSKNATNLQLSFVIYSPQNTNIHFNYIKNDLAYPK